MEQADAWQAYETARLLERSNIELGRFARAFEHKGRADRIESAWPEFADIFRAKHGSSNNDISVN